MRTCKCERIAANEGHTNIQRNGLSHRLSWLPVSIAGILLFYSAAQAASGEQSDNTATLELTPTLLSDIEAMQSRIRSLQKEIANITTVGPESGTSVPSTNPTQELQRLDEQIQQLTRQREKLQQTVKQLEGQLQKLPPDQEAERRKLEAQIAQSQEQLRALENQLAQLQKERVRADYAATLQAREQRRQAGELVGPPPGQPLAATERRLGTMESRLSDLARGQEQLRQSLGAIQQDLQAIRDLRNKETGQLQALAVEMGTIGNQMHAMAQQLQAESKASSTGRQERQTIEERQAEQMRRLEELRDQLRRLQEQLTPLVQRIGPERELFNQRLDRLNAEVGQVRETLDRIERERLGAQTDLRAEVQQLREQLNDVRANVMRIQGTLSVMLAQTGRSTVGSAGYTWGW